MNIIEEIAQFLVENGSRISTAESCTSGYVSNILTSIPGSSNFFEGSLVVYSNNAKINVLGVDKSLIDEYTEVSEQVAKNMADRVKEIMGTEYSIATTGYADVKGFGTNENPPGTIYIAVSTPEKTYTKRLTLKDSRTRNVYLATNEALEILREHLKIHQVV